MSEVSHIRIDNRVFQLAKNEETGEVTRELVLDAKSIGEAKRWSRKHHHKAGTLRVELTADEAKRQAAVQAQAEKHRSDVQALIATATVRALDWSRARRISRELQQAAQRALREQPRRDPIRAETPRKPSRPFVSTDFDTTSSSRGRTKPPVSTRSGRNSRPMRGDAF